MKERALSFFCLSFSLEEKAAKRSNELCGRKNNLLFSSSSFFNNFLSRCQNARAIKKNASIYFFPPRTLRARLHRIRDRMVASTALFQPTTLLRLVLLYLQRRDDDDETDEEETTVTKALVSVLSSQFSFVRFTDIFWAYLAATATVFSRSVVKSNAATSEWSLLDGVTVGLETVVGRGTVASGIGAGQIYGVGYEVTSSAAAAINQVFEQQYDFRKRTRRRKLLDVDLKAYAASVSRTINATKLASMIVNRRRSVKNTSRKLLFDDDDDDDDDDEADDIERNMLHTLVPMFLGNVPVSVRDEFIQSLQSVIIDPSLVLSFELNIARVNVLIPRKGYSAFENAQLFRAGQRNLWSGYLQKRRSGVGASFSSAVGASFSPGDKLAFDIQDTTEKLKAATDILDQLNADRVAKAHFSNATKIDVDPFNLPDGSVVPDSESVGLASLTYAITISINFGQRIGVLA